eukprot:4834327-Amphidinium_carterae.1
MSCRLIGLIGHGRVLDHGAGTGRVALPTMSRKASTTKAVEVIRRDKLDGQARTLVSVEALAFTTVDLQEEVDSDRCARAHEHTRFPGMVALQPSTLRSPEPPRFMKSPWSS